MADLLSIVTTSDKRKNLLLLLQQSGPKTMDEIRNILKVTTTGMLPQIKILSSHGLVRKINGTYALTEMGGVVTAHLDRLLGTLAIFEKEKEFWKTHDLSGIPPHLRMRIAELRDYRIISSGEEELYDSHSEFQDQVRQSKVVKGFAPIVHPSYPQLFLSLAQKGVEVSLILSANVYAKCERKYGHLLQEFLKSPYANMYVTDKDFKLSFILTNAYFSMALYFLDGRFDTKLDVASFHPSALKWGEDLFIHCLEQSRQVPPP